MQEKIEKLYSFFDDLSDVEKKKFFTHAKRVNFKKDNILFWQGDLCGGILYLEKGSIKVYIQNDDGEEITLYTLNPGEQCVINTSSSISQTPAIGSAVALCDIECYMLDSKIIKELMNESKAYQEYMFSLFTMKLASLATLIEDLKFKPLKQRVLKFLKSKNTREIKITHNAIAQNLGTSRVVISRILKELEKEKKISLGRGIIGYKIS
ncbi:MAG: Crp/Fnr family transcriptional regulator [Campylobacteraceae bacterium]|nr:Crp/Fnr family transcriptional regulator [Campylobacteraceae bacterium]